MIRRIKFTIAWWKWFLFDVDAGLPLWLYKLTDEQRKDALRERNKRWCMKEPKL